MSLRYVGTAAALLMVLAGCGAARGGAAGAATPSAAATFVPGTPGPEMGRRVDGIIDYYQDGTQGVLTAPATVKAGQPFEITVATFGGGCESVGGASVEVSGVVATIAVWDWTVAGPTVACTAELKRLARTIGVQFDQPGTATLRITGQRVGQETTGQPTVIEQAITVQ